MVKHGEYGNLDAGLIPNSDVDMVFSSKPEFIDIAVIPELAKVLVVRDDFLLLELDFQ